MSIYDEKKETSIGKKNLLEKHLEKKINYGYRQSVPTFLGFDAYYIRQGDEENAIEYFKTLKNYLEISLKETNDMIKSLTPKSYNDNDNDYD